MLIVFGRMLIVMIVMVSREFLLLVRVVSWEPNKWLGSVTPEFWFLEEGIVATDPPSTTVYI